MVKTHLVFCGRLARCDDGKGIDVRMEVPQLETLKNIKIDVVFVFFFKFLSFFFFYYLAQM